MAGYDGLAMALYDVNDQSFTDKGADNFHSITLTDATTVTSGYIQPFYASITQTGGESAGAQINAFAADLFLGGAHAGEVSGGYIYIAESGTFTSGGILSGYTVYFAPMASATPPTYRAGFHAYSEEAAATVGSGLDAGLMVESAGASGTWGCAIGIIGVTPPEYFIQSSTAIGTSRMVAAYAVSDAATFALRVKFGSSVYNIPMVPDSCT